MAEITVYKKDGSKKKDVAVPAEIFEAKINVRLLDQIVRMYVNNKRTGNAHSKTRAEVRGGGKRPWKQKGTGRARASSIRSPLWRGGGIVFGPRAKVVYYEIPKGLRRNALISALSKKFDEAGILGVESIDTSIPKTKDISSMLKNLNIAGRKVLYVVNEVNDNLRLATRNVANLTVKNVKDINAHHVIRKAVVLFDEEAIKTIESRILSDDEIVEKEEMLQS